MDDETRRIFRGISRLVVDEIGWLREHAIGHLSESDPAVERIDTVKQAALGAFRGSFDLASTASRVIHESFHLLRDAAAGVSLVRPTLEWYLRGMWLRHGRNTEATDLYVSFGKEEGDPKPKMGFDKLCDFTKGLTVGAADDSYATHTLQRFKEIRELHQMWNNQIHGGPKAMLESVFEESVASRYNFGMLTDTSMIIGRTAFWACAGIMRTTRPGRDLGIVLERMVELEQRARDLGYERE